MPIRFLEYLKHENKNISLYVVQDEVQPKALSFEVTIRDGKELVTLRVQNVDEGWQISPQVVPRWIGDIKALLIEQIESKVAKSDLHFSSLDRTG